MVLQPWEPYGNIFWNDSSIEEVDQRDGVWRINNGATDTNMVGIHF